MIQHLTCLILFCPVFFDLSVFTHQQMLYLMYSAVTFLRVWEFFYSSEESSLFRPVLADNPLISWSYHAPMIKLSPRYCKS